MRSGKYILQRGFILALTIILSFAFPLTAQRQMEKLDRGLLAVKVPSGVFVSWRVLGTEWKDVSYNLYRGTEKLNQEPISGATNFLDGSGTPESAYYIRAIVNGTETEASDTVTPWEHSYYDLPVRDIPGGYELNDASVGDLDGDGEYEIVVKRISPDMSENPTYTHLLEAYHLDGTYIWTIDYGSNRLGPQQINFMVYDLDGDGKAEVVTKTSEGTIDGTGAVIGDTDGDNITNYRYSATADDITQGPEFLSVYEGTTGKELDRINYIARDPLEQWGLPGMNLTQLAHRADAVMIAVTYANGKTPTLVMCRGIYHRTKMVALNFRDGHFSELWRFDSEEWPEGFRGQGNHNLSVADVDDDGCDEIVYGSMTVDHDGRGLYGTGLGHGDAMHVSDMDPDRPGLEVWQAHENGPHYGGTYRDAATGEILIQYFGNRDMGRACAGDITADYPGYELWGATECPIYNVGGSILGPTNVPVNFMVWWDGDLLREFLDHLWLGTEAGVGIGTISKYNGSDDVTILQANGTYSTNYTKGNPCLSADILGDWREEVIWRTTDNRYLRIYTSTYPTTHRIYTLMHDPQYRLAIAWQNNAYNQPPHPGFFLGAGMDSLPPPPITGEKLVWNKGDAWDVETSTSWIRNGSSSVFHDGDEVLFDILGGPTDTIHVSGNPEPSSFTVYSPTNYTFSGPGSITGTTGLLKAGSGTLVIRNHNTFTGYTAVWDGTLLVHGFIDSHVNVKKFATAGGSGHFGGGITLEHGSSLVAGEAGSADTLKISGRLTAQADVTWHLDLSGDSTGLSLPSDIIRVTGDLVLDGTQIIIINQLNDSLQRGSYTLFTYTGSFTGDLDTIKVNGVAGIPWEIYDSGGAIRIRFLETRDPGNLFWQGGAPNDWDLVTSFNWLNKGIADWFVSGDTVNFTDDGLAYNLVNLEGDLYPGQVKVESSGDYRFSGTGKISGVGDIVKNGSGKLGIETRNDYSGSTFINDGTIEIGTLAGKGQPGPLGTGTGNGGNGDDDEDNGEIVLNGGTLRLTGSATSDRDIHIGPLNGTIDLYGGEFRMDGILSGEGQLAKTGNGTLAWSAANQHLGGTLLMGGRIHLGTEEANLYGPGPGLMILQDATLSMIDDRNSYTTDCDWDLSVPEGHSGWLNLDSRCTLTGSLGGSGILNLYIPFIRSELAGDWSTFTGRINTSTTADGGSFLVGNPAGYPGAHLHLGDYVTALYRYTSNLTLELGTLTGTALSRLGAGGEGNSTITWKVGGSNANATFDGVICDDQFKNSGASAAIVKTGTGTWTLTGSNTYSGGTTVETGSLRIANSGGSATGSGAVRVQSNAVLSGTGIIAGPVTVEPGGFLTPGPSPGTFFTIDSSLVMETGSYLGFEIDPLNKKHSILKVSGSFTMNGTIYFTNSGSVLFAGGDVFHLVDAGSIDGELAGIIPSSPGAGLRWDTSDWSSGSTIRVQAATYTEEISTGPLHRMFPNPVQDELNIELSKVFRQIHVSIENVCGIRVVDQTFLSASRFSLGTQRMEPGWYILKLETGDIPITEKFIKQ
jgi:autotransporter-associated beta strand protein